MVAAPPSVQTKKHPRGGGHDAKRGPPKEGCDWGKDFLVHINASIGNMLLVCQRSFGISLGTYFCQATNCEISRHTNENYSSQVGLASDPRPLPSIFLYRSKGGSSSKSLPFYIGPKPFLGDYILVPVRGLEWHCSGKLTVTKNPLTGLAHIARFNIPAFKAKPISTPQVSSCCLVDAHLPPRRGDTPDRGKGEKRPSGGKLGVAVVSLCKTMSPPDTFAGGFLPTELARGRKRGGMPSRNLCEGPPGRGRKSLVGEAS
ncbi:hypothetical protein RRG08_007220 [Elysia crispata]|uniref:Uncharacterized protein n=1 Tax=Elysia crispata TaxID=231223 RepID=A0AAE0Z4N9_9GAST|nr:hypothetical protein RRG08_007220 [Elysia crispata]